MGRYKRYKMAALYGQNIPPSEDHGASPYWDDRYTNNPEESFDWYQRYEGIKHLVTRFVDSESKVLVVGCGNSQLSAEMYEDGITDITNIDISEPVIEQMKQRYGNEGTVLKTDMRWQATDVLKLAVNESTFEAVIDKGTMDSILRGAASARRVAQMCKNISRVLKPGGVYIVLSYGQPDYRLSYFAREKYNWKVMPVQPISKPCVGAVADPDPANVHYVYIMQKNT